MKNFSVYLAAPWFNKEQEERHDLVLRLLDQKTNNVLSPKRQFVCPPNADALTRQKTFRGNLDCIRRADIVVAITDGKDPGTLWEMGYAYARGVPVIACAFTLGDKPFNLMLAEGCAATCRTLDELYAILKKYEESGTIPTSKYEGSIE